MNTTLSRRDAARLCAGAICGATLIRPRPTLGQSATPQQFDVSTVRPSSADPASSSGITTGNGRIHGENVTLKRCIMGAYGVGQHQIVGGPDWMDSEHFDIQAKVDQPIDDDVLMVMLQGLLADRFKLALHRETKTASAFVLEVDKKGSKLEKAEGGDSNTTTSASKIGGITMSIKNTDMDSFCRILARTMDLPVVNNTQLKGLFNFTLHWTPDTATPSKHEAADDVSIFTALPEQLGLRLRSAKAPVEVLVIDHIEKPSEN
jgi:uncharacterized protein (TIGR03435 family)